MTLSQQDMEAGLSLASHYVDVRLVQRQIQIGSGKNGSKCLEKDLVAIGDGERRRDSLARSQVRPCDIIVTSSPTEKLCMFFFLYL